MKQDHSDEGGRGYWFPYKIILTNQSWYEGVSEVKEQFMNFEISWKLVHMIRQKIKPISCYNTLAIFYAEVDFSLLKLNLEVENTKLKWCSLTDMEKLLHEEPGLLGLEPLEFANEIINNSDWQSSFALKEVSFEDVLLNNLCTKSPDVRPHYKLLLESAKFSEKDEQQIYADYMSFCYPSQFMNRTVFQQYLKCLGWTDSTLTGQIFHALDSLSRGILTYKDVVLGLAAMEPCTQHGGPPAEVRCRYIFRFYDANNDGRMEYSEFK
ncbi:uncharacterized protein LOC106470767 isoform X2 [Limulus polyphemus]|uniref:Uncharacterized protein LOC106470767 isoform X2 n=1 Tax=Limulus polyphemus TaxID=6850 RepID=A0ABM1TGV3_LIMPO|nr:uncharacterized protein LOC106470767 isoform X2 [Limulus polyphemus]